MHPYINREIKCAFRWYRSASLRHRIRLGAIEAPNDKCIPSLFFPAKTILPFQLLLGPDAYQVTAWRLMNLDGTLAMDLASSIPELVVEQYADPSRAIACLEEPLVLTTLPEGTYEMEIVADNGEVSYSETFELGCANAGALIPGGEFQPENTLWTHGQWAGRLSAVLPGSGPPATPGTTGQHPIATLADNKLWSWNGSAWLEASPGADTYWGISPQEQFYIFTGGAWSSPVTPPVIYSDGSACWQGVAGVNLAFEPLAGEFPALVILRFTVFRGSPITGTIYVSVNGVFVASYTEADNGSEQNLAGYVEEGGRIEFWPTADFNGCVQRITAHRAADGSDCMTRLEWRDCGALGTVSYGIGSGAFSNILYLRESGCATSAAVYDPTPQINEGAETDRNGATVVTKARKEVEWRMEVANAPWHVMDALSEMVISSDRMIRVPWGGGDDLMIAARIETLWSTKDRTAMGSLLFRVDEASVATGCCDAFARPCPDICGPAAGVYGISDPEAGLEYLYLNGAIATYCGEECEDLVDENGFNNIRHCNGGLASTTADGFGLMRWDGDSWELALSIVSVEEEDEGCAAVTVVAVIPPGFHGVIETTVDGDEWTAAAPGSTAAELAVGVTFARPAAAQYLRVTVVGFDGCVVASSDPEPMPCACPVFIISTNLAALCESLPQGITATVIPYSSDGGPALPMPALGEAVGIDYRINGGAWVSGAVQTPGAPNTYYTITDIPVEDGDSIEIRVRFLERPWCDAVVSGVFACP